MSVKLPGIFAEKTDRQKCLPHLHHLVVEEDDVGGAPDGAWDGAVGPRGHDDFEKLGRSCKIGHKRLMGIGGERLRDRQMLKDREYDLVGGSEGNLHAGAPELQQRIIFVKVPGQAGADVDGALKALVSPPNFIFRRWR